MHKVIPMVFYELAISIAANVVNKMLNIFSRR